MQSNPKSDDEILGPFGVNMLQNGYSLSLANTGGSRRSWVMRDLRFVKVFRNPSLFNSSFSSSHVDYIIVDLPRLWGVLKMERHIRTILSTNHSHKHDCDSQT